MDSPRTRRAHRRDRLSRRSRHGACERSRVCLQAAERRARVEEITGLIRDQIADDERTAFEAPLDEIDLIAVTTNLHIQIHRQRRARGGP